MKLLIEKDVEIPMRDGVILRADIYRPDDGEKHPALVFRSPWSKKKLKSPSEVPVPRTS